MLQPRRPKEKVKLAPHEPHVVDVPVSIGGSLKRSGLSTPNASQYAANYNSNNAGLATLERMTPPPTTLSESSALSTPKTKLRLSLFGIEGTNTPDKEDSQTALIEQMSDDQLFRELIAHTAAEYQLDVPLCCECAPLYYTRLQLDLEDAEVEIAEMERQLLLFPSTDALELRSAQFEAEIQQLQKAFEQLETDFDELVIRNGQVMEQSEVYEARTLDLQSLKDDYWSRYSRFKHEDMCQRDLHGTVTARLADREKQLEWLRKCCGLNDIFNIAFTGHYATINGLRLGLRSPTLKSAVDWDEVSAAFGFLLLLFGKLGTALSHNWQAGSYRIRLDGSFSGLYRPNGEAFNLFLDKESWSLLRFRDQSAFDRGFEAFVLCVIEVSSIIYKRDPEFHLPYPLKSQPLSIGGQEMISSRSYPEKWTHLAKLLASDIKTILKWLVSHGLVK